MADKVKFIFRTADLAPDAPPRLITWPCLFEEPQDGGSRRKLAVDVQFVLLSEAEITKAYTTDADLFDAVVRGFPGFQDEEGKDVPLDVAKAFFRSKAYARKGILESYLLMTAGIPEKN